MKLGIMIGPTSRKNYLTFNGDPVPDIDSRSLYTSSPLQNRDFRRFISMSPPINSLWLHLRCDVCLEEGEY